MDSNTLRKGILDDEIQVRLYVIITKCTDFISFIARKREETINIYKCLYYGINISAIENSDDPISFVTLHFSQLRYIIEVGSAERDITEIGPKNKPKFKLGSAIGCVILFLICCTHQ